MPSKKDVPPRIAKMEADDKSTVMKKQSKLGVGTGDGSDKIRNKGRSKKPATPGAGRERF